MVRSESLDGLEKTRDVETNILPATDASRDASPAGVHRDAVFGELNEKGPNYRNVSLKQRILAGRSSCAQVGWISTSILMTKTNVGLGVLGIPFVFQVVGIVPGVLLIVFYNFIVMCEYTMRRVGQAQQQGLPGWSAKSSCDTPKCTALPIWVYSSEGLGLGPCCERCSTSYSFWVS